MKATFVLAGSLLGVCMATAEWVWTRLDKPSPPSVYGHSLVYDSARGRMVMFGGNTYFVESSGNAILNAVWEWDGETWHEIRNSGLPTAFAQGAMAYDSKRGKTVYFGGWQSGGGRSNRTFEWDGTTWIEHLGNTRPPARSHAVMAFDEDRGVCVLFGGSDFSGSHADTWEYDGTEWERVSTGGPSARFDSAMVYDSVANRMVLHGGFAGYNQPAFSDTWNWDGKTWTQLASNNRAPALIDHAASFDPVNNEIVFTFGYNYVPPTQHANGWVLKNGNWRQIKTGSMPVRNAHASAYHPGIGSVIVFGGRGGRRYSDLWIKDGDNWVSDDPAPPSYRDGSLAYDVARRNYVYFGGAKTHGAQVSVQHSNETWIHDGRWRRVFPSNSPTARSNALIVYDEVAEETLLIGGGTLGLPGSRIVEMWSWNGENWRRLDPVGGVPPYAWLVWFDRALGKVALLTARNSWSNLSVWTWNGTEWIDTGIAGTDQFHTVAYDRTSEVALFLDFQNRTWSWDGSSFTLRHTESGSTQERPVFIFDNSAGKAVKYGGHIAFGGNTSWASMWEGFSWASVGAQPPGGRGEAAFASKPSGPGLVFAGWAHGYGGLYYEYYDDTWSVEWKD